MPSKWEDIKDHEFYVINGQYTLAAARRMLETYYAIERTRYGTGMPSLFGPQIC